MSASAGGVVPSAGGMIPLAGGVVSLAGGARRLRGTDGFTLVEVLVAFIVLATLLSVMYRGVVAVRAGSVAFDERSGAAVVARSVLAESLADKALALGTHRGVRDGRRYTVTATAIDLSASLPRPPPPDKPSVLGAPVAAESKPQWVPQRIVISVETGGRPVDTEVVRLVKPAEE